MSTRSLFLLSMVASVMAVAVNGGPVVYGYDKTPYYQFGYEVNDYYNNDHHGHMEYTSNDQVRGEYKVKLPDGRIQIISYEADDYGFRPMISYKYPHKPIPVKGHPTEKDLFLIAVRTKDNRPRYVVLSRKRY